MRCEMEMYKNFGAAGISHVSSLTYTLDCSWRKFSVLRGNLKVIPLYMLKFDFRRANSQRLGIGTWRWTKWESSLSRAFYIIQQYDFFSVLPRQKYLQRSHSYCCTTRAASCTAAVLDCHVFSGDSGKRGKLSILISQCWLIALISRTRVILAGVGNVMLEFEIYSREREWNASKSKFNLM